MRISDWSSDVCSSDLATGSLPDLDPPVVALAVDTAGAEREGVGGQPLPDRRLQRRTVLADHAAAADLPGAAGEVRSEERRVGKACVRTCRSRWSPYH